jgi:hypothetical protein
MGHLSVFECFSDLQVQKGVLPHPFTNDYPKIPIHSPPPLHCEVCSDNERAANARTVQSGVCKMWMYIVHACDATSKENATRLKNLFTIAKMASSEIFQTGTNITCINYKNVPAK